MSDVIGPVIAIVLIFVVYYVASYLDIFGDIKKSKLDLDKITAESKREEIAVRRRELEVEMGRLAIEARRLDRLEHRPQTDAEDAEFKVFEDKKDERE